MSQTQDQISELRQLDPKDNAYAMRFVDLLLKFAQQANASDLHLQPTPEGLDVRIRIDGALQSVGVFASGDAVSPVSRLKVLAGLLTYESETPQEGRLPGDDSQPEMRVSTFPTLCGERAVVRLFPSQNKLQRLDELGLEQADLVQLRRWLSARGGAILLAGPAGSGKTTSAYACLRELSAQSSGSQCIMTLEDPIESALPGVVQSQVRESAGFDLHVGLRSLVRQDPETMFVGEIRDAFAAKTVINAALTGHLVLTTFHAEDGAAAVSRLLEMGMEPYLLLSGLRGIVSQRLVRTLCKCGQWSDDVSDRCGFAITRVRKAAGCDACRGSGYSGRQLLAEFFCIGSPEVRQAVLACRDRLAIAESSLAAGQTSFCQKAIRAMENGATSAAEIRRAFGFFSSEDGNQPSLR